MKRKGLSPVIATVLLIAITISMALIIFLWFKGMTEETVTKFGGENIKLSCDKVEFSAEYSDGILSISNDGNIPVYSFRIDAMYEDEHQSEDLEEIFGSGFIPGHFIQGATYSGNIIGHAEDSTSLKIIPILIGNSDEGRKTYVCEDSKSVKEIF